MKALLLFVLATVGVPFAMAQGLQGNIVVVGQASIVVTGHSVALTWTPTQGATSYNVYRGTVHGGPYTKLSSGNGSPAYIDVQVTHNQTLYYVVTAVSNNEESGYSNEAQAIIP
jgi:fibronectin type 3 domain-containing protein